jgi:hypothetical protein
LALTEERHHFDPIIFERFEERLRRIEELLAAILRELRESGT